MSEFDLRIPCANWLLNRGLSPICEVRSLHNCDFIGVRFDKKRLEYIVAVELKLTDVSGVINQCVIHLPRVNEVWAAMPPQTAKAKAKFEQLGIGLLEYTDKFVSVLEPKFFVDRPLTRWQRVASSRKDEWKWRMLHPQMLRNDAWHIKCMNENPEYAKDYRESA